MWTTQDSVAPDTETFNSYGEAIECCIGTEDMLEEFVSDGPYTEGYVYTLSEINESEQQVKNMQEENEYAYEEELIERYIKNIVNRVEREKLKGNQFLEYKVYHSALLSASRVEHIKNGITEFFQEYYKVTVVFQNSFSFIVRLEWDWNS